MYRSSAHFEKSVESNIDSLLVNEYKTSENDEREKMGILFTKLADYGSEYYDDEDVRDAPMVDVMTRIFENNLLSEIESRYLVGSV